jgi:hypothetical protein
MTRSERPVLETSHQGHIALEPWDGTLASVPQTRYEMLQRVAILVGALAAAAVLAVALSLNGFAPAPAPAAAETSTIEPEPPATAATPVTQVDTVYVQPAATPKVVRVVRHAKAATPPPVRVIVRTHSGDDGHDGHDGEGHHESDGESD